MKNELKENDFYKTSELSLVATLQCYNYNIEATDMQNPAKAIFSIRRDEGLDELVRLYFAHQLRVEPIAFANALRGIKSRIKNF